MNRFRRACPVAPARESDAPILIRRFYIGSMPIQAQLYITGNGFVRVLINEKIAVRDRGKPDLYPSYDITRLLIAGENTLAIELSSDCAANGSPYARYRLELDCKCIFSDGSETCRQDPAGPEFPVRIL